VTISDNQTTSEERIFLLTFLHSVSFDILIYVMATLATKKGKEEWFKEIFMGDY